MRNFCRSALNAGNQGFIRQIGDSRFSGTAPMRAMPGTLRANRGTDNCRDVKLVGMCCLPLRAKGKIGSDIRTTRSQQHGSIRAEKPSAAAAATKTH
jgi:hypothetical protein